MAIKQIYIFSFLFLSVIGFFEISHASDVKPRVIYPKKTDLDFSGTQIDGEIKNPGEFYFQHRPEEKFDSLVKRRKNFHKEMLRDVVLGR